ncbi:hypothetical protein ANN_02472 [Periplaneta americana]|uniref:Uncharacterized protein n=1 Tax=Periplaneta americana TaxID=6978 RepID=A0ABQ8TYW3_PERAM|nr:hypothetical protein ANN_02472 [Periplaneta americana]
MAGLCEGGNEPSGSLKAICNDVRFELTTSVPQERRSRGALWDGARRRGERANTAREWRESARASGAGREERALDFSGDAKERQQFSVIQSVSKPEQASLVYRSSTRVCVRNCISIRRPEFECSGPQLEGPEFECSGPQLEGPEFEYSELSLKICGSRYCEILEPSDQSMAVHNTAGAAGICATCYHLGLRKQIGDKNCGPYLQRRSPTSNWFLERGLLVVDHPSYILFIARKMRPISMYSTAKALALAVYGSNGSEFEFQLGINEPFRAKVVVVMKGILFHENKIYESYEEIKRKTEWDHKRNEDVMEELQLEPGINHVKHYHNNWINHLHRMHRDRIPKVMLHYRPNGKRSLGRTKKRWIENSPVRS